MELRSIGTKKIRIVQSIKLGSSALDSLAKKYSILTYDLFYDKTKIYVFLIRDSLEKYKSGYKQELDYYFHRSISYQNTNFSKSELNEIKRQSTALLAFYNRLNNNYYDTFTGGDLITKIGIRLLCDLHDYNKSLNWMVYGTHAYPLIENLNRVLLKPNVYFLDLKNLSNPKFLKWLQERDGGWKVVSEIARENRTSKSFWSQIDLFFEEYIEKKISQNKILISPFYDLLNTELKDEFMGMIHLAINELQILINTIRNEHERYIIL